MNTHSQVLGYNLTPRQNALINYLLPSLAACILYIFIIAIDTGVIFRYYKDGDPIWASSTLFVMYLPALGNFALIVSDWDYWPEPEKGATKTNYQWFFMKFLEHLCFPAWNMWRFAERLFWSIEAIRGPDNESIEDALSTLREPRLIEQYVFLQAYLHALPQVLLQLQILIRHNSDVDKETKNVQAASILFNLAKMAATTAHYQRFRTQKIAGTQYPWFKKRKIERSSIKPHNQDVVLRRPLVTTSRSVVDNKKEGVDEILRIYDIQPPGRSERRRSSDIYLEPEPQNGHPENISGSEETLPPKNTNRFSLRALSEYLHLRTTLNPNRTDFNINRIRYKKGLKEDDAAGKLIAFLWWSTFLLGRILAISVFAYFFPKSCTGLLFAHAILVLVILSYDIRTNDVKRNKAVFFIFTAFVYIFCIIEFKIRFKKAYLIYAVYFGTIYFENFIMCMVWYNDKLEYLENDYWFRYCFYIIILSSLLSSSAMIFYLILNKPKSVLIPET